jgi:hypothetical protein
MKLSPAPVVTSGDPDPPGEAGTRLYGRWLVLARVGWVVVFVLALGVFIARIPYDLADIHIICTTPPCNGGARLTLVQVHDLHHLGLSFDFYTLFEALLVLVFEIGYVAIGMLIFLRKPDDRMALITSLALVTFGNTFTSNPVTPLPPLLHVLSLWMAFFGSICYGLFLYTFPTGRFTSRWVGFLTLVWITYWGYNNLVLATFIQSAGLATVLFFSLLVSMVVVQVYRYRRVSTPTQRQQTKWVVYGLSVALLGGLVIITAEMTFPLNIIAYMVSGALLFAFLLLIPLSIGIAILRYRLWDIDILIKRTLVYSALTISLGLVYAGLVIGLQFLLRGFIGQTNEVALVVSTLAVYVLFQPLRRRIQRVIDRRFYRSKYDAAKTLAAFSATLRDEVDLEQLREHLLAVVQETMQPAHVSLWLRQPQHPEKSSERMPS